MGLVKCEKVLTSCGGKARGLHHAEQHGSATHFWDGITFLTTVNMMPPRDMLFWGNGVPARRIQALNSSPAHASDVRHYLHERHLLPATRLHPKQHVANGRAGAQWSAVRVKYIMGRSILRSVVEAPARASFPVD